MAEPSIAKSAKHTFFQVRELTGVYFPAKDLAASSRWYAENLGLVPNPQGSRLVLLGIPNSGSALALYRVEGKIPKKLRVSFKVGGGTPAIEAWRLRLKRAGLTYSVRMRESRISGLFLADPDGHTVEIWSD